MSYKVVILDRDGVINEDSPAYIKSLDDWIPVPGSIEAISLITAKGYPVYVATNQSGVGRGYYSLETLLAIHGEMVTRIENAGGHLAGICYCPHLPEDKCPCRKPRPGMLLDIAKQAGVSTRDCVFVGDSQKDLDAALAAGCTPVLVETGNGAETRLNLNNQIPCFSNLLSFAQSL